jgi:hypothetical protein
MLFSDTPLASEAVRVANEMRGSGEPVPTKTRDRLGSSREGLKTRPRTWGDCQFIDF